MTRKINIRKRNIRGLDSLYGSKSRAIIPVIPSRSLAPQPIYVI